MHMLHDILYYINMYYINIYYIYYINCTKITHNYVYGKYCNLADSNCANICMLYNASNTGCIFKIVDQNLSIFLNFELVSF